MQAMEGKELLMETNPAVVKEALRKAKGEILKEFEKVCPTDKSFDRIVKDMHDIFDSILDDLKIKKVV
jgi:hypothetical protein